MRVLTSPVFSGFSYGRDSSAFYFLTVCQQISHLLKGGGHISTSLLKLVTIFPRGVMHEGSCSR